MSQAAGRPYRSLAGHRVGDLRSVSKAKARLLEEAGIETVFDLLVGYPYRYIDRTRQIDIASATAEYRGQVRGGGVAETDRGSGDESGGQVGRSEELVVLGEVRQCALVGAFGYGRGRGRGAGRVEVEIGDGSGTLKVVFFNQTWRAKQLPVGTEALFTGTVKEYRGTPQMVNPMVDVTAGVLAGEDDDIEDSDSGVEDRMAEQARRRTLRIVPVYPQSEKFRLSSAERGRWVGEALERAGDFADPIPDAQRRSLGLVDRTTALRSIHLPEEWPVIAEARRRLAFDELLRLQMVLALRRRKTEQEALGIRHAVAVADVVGSGSEGTSLVGRFLGALPFELTKAQRRAVAAIAAEMAGPLPMHRLLQGDVGSGKTVVALCALLMAVQGGHQGALMVPTEVLAEQHLMAVADLLGGLEHGGRKVEVNLLTSRIKGAARRQVIEGLGKGTVDLVIGTHALLTEDVAFSSLGMVVIDEQHRFGVEQRATLRDKGVATPDLLVMTATPIPRTAAMVLFGDLDMVVLDELPPGRVPIETVWARTKREESSAWKRVRQEVAAGRRAYVVCPLVDESDLVVARSATEEFERLAAAELEGLALGLLHGQMPSSEKESVMEALRAGEIDVLVATTAIEVGVDVAEATVMVVLDADRFGISQLHQLRGRVGRGALPSWCYFLAKARTPDAATRLEALVASNDGFELAETDLNLRGEGTILGARQKGTSDLRLARLGRDRDLLEAAQGVAAELVADGLEAHPLLADEIRLFLDPEEETYLFKS